MSLSLAADVIFSTVFCAQDLSGINLLRIASSIFLQVPLSWKPSRLADVSVGKLMFILGA